MTEWTPPIVPRFAVALVQSHHSLLASTARNGFRNEGRGVLAMTFRGDCPTTPELRESRIGYRSLHNYSRRTAGLTGEGRSMADDIIRRIETYDPGREMVVAVVVGPQFLTCVLTVPLDVGPMIHDEAAGLH